MTYTSKLASLQWPDGQSNPSGIPTICYFIEKSAIATFPKLTSSPTSPEEAITYDGDFTLVEGAYFKKLYTTQGQGSIDYEFVGVKDCKMVTNKGKFLFPDLSPKANALASSLSNTNTIFVVPRYVSGGSIQYTVLGAQDFDSEITVTGTSGAAPGDQKGLTINVSAPDFIALPIYEGTLTLEDGTLDCDSNVFTAKTSSDS